MQSLNSYKMMIGVSTLYKSSLVYTHSSFFPSLFTRDFSTVECYLHRLVFEIKEVYALFKKDDDNYELSEGDILGIQNALLSGNYHFSPLRLVRGSKPGSNSTLMLGSLSS